MNKFRLLTLVTLALAFVAQPLTAQTVSSFEGIDATQLSNPQFDVDPNGAIGTRQFMEWTNAYFQAYDKVTSAPVWSKPQQAATPWQKNGITACNNIDRRAHV